MKLALTIFLALVFAGCHSNIIPMRPIENEDVWVLDAPAATEAATTSPGAPGATTAADTQSASAPATEPATQPGHLETRVNDPNEASRFVYKATYDNVWQQAITLLNRTGFALDRQDYRLGVLTTKPLPSSQIVEFWKPQLANANDAMENTLHSQRRTVRLTISRVPGKPDFYEIGVQVMVERESNPTEEIGGPVFVEGSGFGRNSLTLRSDFAPPLPEAARWVVVGHDPNLEKKLMDELFLHI